MSLEFILKIMIFLKAFARIKEQYRIPNNLIELELTESIFFDNQQIESIKDTIHQIHQYGFLCSLDDLVLDSHL